MNAPIQIRNEEAVRKIRRAAELTGRSITEVVSEGVDHVLKKAEHLATLDERRARVDQLLREIDALPKVGPPLTDDELYDDYGLPR